VDVGARRLRKRLEVAAAESLRGGLQLAGGRGQPPVELRRQELPHGEAPPAFDVLYWNQDSVRLAAGVHRDFIRIGLENAFAEPGALEVLATPVDLGAVDLDSYVVAGLTDHIGPWENAYRSTQLLGGSSRFVLSTSGHIQALVNPPAPDSRSTYQGPA
jgi:polyhydroxyalkanoate synthase subunit PhaC